MMTLFVMTLAGMVLIIFAEQESRDTGKRNWTKSVVALIGLGAVLLLLVIAVTLILLLDIGGYRWIWDWSNRIAHSRPILYVITGTATAFLIVDLLRTRGNGGARQPFWQDPLLIILAVMVTVSAGYLPNFNLTEGSFALDPIQKSKEIALKQKFPEDRKMNQMDQWIRMAFGLRYSASQDIEFLDVTGVGDVDSKLKVSIQKSVHFLDDFFGKDLQDCVKQLQQENHSHYDIMEGVRPLSRIMTNAVYARRSGNEGIPPVTNKDFLHAYGDMTETFKNLARKKYTKDGKSSACCRLVGTGTKRNSGCLVSEPALIDWASSKYGAFPELFDQPYAYMLTATMLLYERNQVAAKDLLSYDQLSSAQANRFREELNFNFLNGLLAYYDPIWDGEDVRKHNARFLDNAESARALLGCDGGAKQDELTADLCRRYAKAKAAAENALAYSYALDGKHERLANSYAESAVRFDPNAPNYLDTLGFVKMSFAVQHVAHDRAGAEHDLRMAIRHFREAIKQYTDGTQKLDQTNVWQLRLFEAHLAGAKDLLAGLE